MKLDPTGVPMAQSRSEAAMVRLEQRAQQAGDSREDLQHVATEFEALMLTKLVEAMRATVPKADLTVGNASQGMYDNMMDDALAHHLADNGGLGVAKELMKSWTRTHNEPPRDVDELAAFARRTGATTHGELRRAESVGSLRRVQAPERNEPIPHDELTRILDSSSRDLGGLDDGETPLSELPPPTRDEWLFSPQAEQVLRALISNDPASPDTDGTRREKQPGGDTRGRGNSGP